MSAVDTLVEPVAWLCIDLLYGGTSLTRDRHHAERCAAALYDGLPSWEVVPLVPSSALEASEAKIAALTAERDALREAVEAVDQHERSNFIGDPLDKARRASWRGVMRKVRAALRQEGKP